MPGVNKAIIVGRLGQDPEIRYTKDGTAIANFTVATSDRWKDKQTGEMQEVTEWHRIVAYRRVAEICGQFLRKGRQVYVEGKIQTRQWEDKDGNKRWTTEIEVRDMEMIGGKGDGEVAENRKPPQPEKYPSHKPKSVPRQEALPNDDIPF